MPERVDQSNRRDGTEPAEVAQPAEAAELAEATAPLRQPGLPGRPT